MAGVTLEYVAGDALREMQAMGAALADPTPLQRDIGELLLIIHQRRFRAQESPDGAAWQALSPGYLKRKRKNKDKILTLDGNLRSLLRYQVDGDDLLFGSDRPYAAIHHFGGKIERQARAATVYFRQGKDGDIGRQFVRKDKSNFAQDVKVGPYTINMPARPWLGTSADDDEQILQRVLKYISQFSG